MNNLSRNRPVGFVVGAAGFIGSHLVEELLAKNIQVIGIDDFSTGFKDNLAEANKNRDFQLISSELPLSNNLVLPRLDYAVFAITDSENSPKYQKTFKAFLDFCLPLTTKIIFVSSIDLYDSDSENDNLSFAENYLAKKAAENKINARILRLSAVFGPRMHFRGNDPIFRLIKSSISGKLNQEASPLEFTTRALYIKDAIKLLIKTIMHGATSQKIYDGVAIEPIKISEIKQVLLDPLWYEQKGFTPTLLPPWPTPNLNKTRKELSFKPTEDIVKALKETQIYFNSHKDRIPESSFKESPKKVGEVEEEVEKADEIKEKETDHSKNSHTPISIKSKNIKSKLAFLAGILIIFFALIFPFLRFGFEIWQAKTHLENSVTQMSAGNFINAENESKEAIGDIKNLNNSIEKASFIKQLGIFNQPYQTTSQTLSMANKIIEANHHTITGAKYLATGLSIVSGEKEGDSLKNFADAKTELETADSDLGEVSANLSEEQFSNNLPSYLKEIFGNLESKVISYRKTISLGKTLADLLPEIIAPDGVKNYLIMLQDNRILRPGGGVLKAYTELTFDHGRLAKIKADSIENLDRQFSDRINPPAELKSDLGETNWRLRDGSFDLDFPTSARNISWFFNKESGNSVSGVIAIDFNAASKLLQAVGPLKINGSNEEINADNLLTKIPLGREGNQPSADLLKGLVERIVYLSKQNWVVLAENSGQSLSQKNLLVYLSDPNAFSYLSSNNWTGKVMSQKVEKIGEVDDFLAFSETNMSLGQDSTAIKRSVIFDNKIDSINILSHQLSIKFSATEKLTGKYRNRFKVYLPAKTKLIKASFGETVIKDISPFSDYGRAGYSWLLELNPNEEKTLTLDYQDINPLKFSNKELSYNLEVLKQPSQQSIPFEFKLAFPLEYKASLQDNNMETDLKVGTGEVNTKTDLSKDIKFKIILNQ
jgi:nucleoside-diphosphate-sugar epimerase